MDPSAASQSRRTARRRTRQRQNRTSRRATDYPIALKSTRRKLFASSRWPGSISPDQRSDWSEHREQWRRTAPDSAGRSDFFNRPFPLSASPRAVFRTTSAVDECFDLKSIFEKQLGQSADCRKLVGRQHSWLRIHDLAFSAFEGGPAVSSDKYFTGSNRDRKEEQYGNPGKRSRC